MTLPTQPAQGMAWSLLRAGTYVFQATCDLTSYSAVPFLATGAIPQSVIGGSGQVAAREMGIDNTGNSAPVVVTVGKLYTQNVPPYTQTTIELGDTAPMVQVTGGGVCLVTFSTTTVPGTEAATNPYAAALGAIGMFLPSGSVIQYAGPTGNIPTGWQLCDGSALSRANEANLYMAIGTLYGAGDGASTFNVPNMSGATAVGTGSGPDGTAYAIAARGGETRHVLTAAESVQHNHPSLAVGYGASYAMSPSGGGTVNMAGTSAQAVYDLTQVKTGPMDGNGNVEGAAASHNNMPPYVVFCWIIKL